MLSMSKKTWMPNPLIIIVLIIVEPRIPGYLILVSVTKTMELMSASIKTRVLMLALQLVERR